MTRVPIVCMAFGEPHGLTDVYVRRLFEMLTRHCPQPFTLTCYSDRPRGVPAGVELRDCASWTELDRAGMRPTTRKIGLFNPAYVEFESFLYLDLSLVIRRDMGALLDGAFARREDLVVVKNWHYDGYNSSVMRIRCGALRVVYDAFVAGERPVQRVQGDQDFLHGTIASRGLQSSVATFPPEQVVSFRLTLEAGRRDPDAARRRMLGATIVKFHGEPKMDVAFARRYRWRQRYRELRRGNFRPVVPLAELKRHWEHSGASR